MLEIIKKDDIAIIDINLKKATLENTENFRTLLMQIIDEGTKKIIVDFSKCEYVDSTFLGTLVVALKAGNNAGCKIKLVCNKKVAFIICEITKLSSVFEVYNELDEAILEFKK